MKNNRIDLDKSYYKLNQTKHKIPNSNNETTAVSQSITTIFGASYLNQNNFSRRNNSNSTMNLKFINLVEKSKFVLSMEAKKNASVLNENKSSSNIKFPLLQTISKDLSSYYDNGCKIKIGLLKLDNEKPENNFMKKLKLNKIKQNTAMVQVRDSINEDQTLENNKYQVKDGRNTKIKRGNSVQINDLKRPSATLSVVNNFEVPGFLNSVDKKKRYSTPLQNIKNEFLPKMTKLDLNDTLIINSQHSNIKVPSGLNNKSRNLKLNSSIQKKFNQSSIIPFNLNNIESTTSSKLFHSERKLDPILKVQEKFNDNHMERNFDQIGIQHKFTNITKFDELGFIRNLKLYKNTVSNNTNRFFNHKVDQHDELSIQQKEALKNIINNSTGMYIPGNTVFIHKYKAITHQPRYIKTKFKKLKNVWFGQ